MQLDQTVGANHVARWTVCKDATVETGSNNTGSNFAIGRYTDAGAIIDTPISINRSTGLITMGAQQWAGAVNGGGQTLVQCRDSRHAGRSHHDQGRPPGA